MLRRRSSASTPSGPKLALVCLDSKGAAITPGVTRVQDYMGERGLVLWSGYHRHRTGTHHSGGANHCAVLFDNHVPTSLNRSDGSDLECLGGASYPAGSIGLVPQRDLYFEVFPQGLAAVRAAMGEKLDWMHDEEVGKFLMAREYDVGKTLTMLENHLKYRNALGLRYDETFDSRLPDCYPVGPADGMDRDGNLLHFTRPGNGGACSPAHFMNNFGIAQMYRWHLYDVEGMKQRLRDCNYSSRRITLLMDLKNVGTISGDAIAFVKKCMAVDTDNSPELLHQTIFINTPSLFRTTFKMFTFFLDERTKQKIQLLGSDYRADLERLIDPKWLPGFAGGSNESWMRYGGAVRLRPPAPVPSTAPHHAGGSGAAAASEPVAAEDETQPIDEEEAAVDDAAPAAVHHHRSRQHGHRHEAERAAAEGGTADRHHHRHRQPQGKERGESRRGHRGTRRTPVIEVEAPEDEAEEEDQQLQEAGRLHRHHHHRDRTPSRRHRRQDGDFLSPRREFAHTPRSVSPGYRYRAAPRASESPRHRARDENYPRRSRHNDADVERHRPSDRRRTAVALDSAELEALERQQRRERREARRRSAAAEEPEQEEEVVVEYYDLPVDRPSRRAHREHREHRDDREGRQDLDRHAHRELRDHESRTRREAGREHRHHGERAPEAAVEFVVDAGPPRESRPSRHHRAHSELRTTEVVEAGLLEGRDLSKYRYADPHRPQAEYYRSVERRSSSRPSKPARRGF